MLWLFDISFFFTLLVLVFVSLNIIEYMHIIYIYISFNILCLLYGNKIKLKFLPINLLYISIIATTSNYNEVIFSWYVIIGIVVLIFSGMYTLFLVRNNLNNLNEKNNILHFVFFIIKNPILLLLFLIITIVNIGIKYPFLHSIDYAFSFDYFYLYYVILFSLWAPSCLISNFILNIYFKDINYFSFKSSINLSGFYKLTLFAVGAFSLKFLFVLYLNSLYLDKNVTNFFSTWNKKIAPLNLWEKFIKIRASRPGFVLSVIPFVMWNSDYGGETDDSFVPQNELKENTIIPPDFKEISDARLFIPKNSNIDPDRDVWNQLTEKGLDNLAYVNMGNSKVAKLSALKNFCTKALNKQLNLFLIPNAKVYNGRTLFDCDGFRKELEFMNSKNKIEAYTYGPMNAILTTYFPAIENFIVVPQSKETDGEVDFLVKKWDKTLQKNIILCVVESKAENSKYSLTRTYSQAIQYANNNHDIDDCYVIINKGPYISVGAYLQDYHTSMGNYDQKGIFFDGYIGLELGENGIKQVGQKNTFYPQHKLYKMGTDLAQKSAIHYLMELIKYGTPDRRDYDY